MFRLVKVCFCSLLQFVGLVGDAGGPQIFDGSLVVFLFLAADAKTEVVDATFA